MKIAVVTPGISLDLGRLPAVTLDALQRYAQASGDEAAVHLDAEAARSFGFPDVIAHGLLVMAWLGSTLSGRFGQPAVSSFSVRFAAPVLRGDVLIASAVVREADDAFVTLYLRVADQAESVKLSGTTKIALDAWLGAPLQPRAPAPSR